MQKLMPSSIDESYGEIYLAISSNTSDAPSTEKW